MIDLFLAASSPTPASSQESTKNTSSDLPLSLGADDQVILNQVIDYYHQALKQSPKALNYLASRGLNDPTLIDTFKLGYCNRTLCRSLPDKKRKAGAQIRSQLQSLGILKDSGYEHFNGSLVVPVANTQGHIVEIYGRKTANTYHLSKGTPVHLYLPGNHQGVWNSEALLDAGEIILCEALINAMTFWVHGFKHVTASYGINGFTDAHRALFQDHPIKRVLIAYDRDEGGDKAALLLAEELNQTGIECYRVVLPVNRDINELACQSDNPRQMLKECLHQAQLIGTEQTLPDSASIPYVTDSDTRPQCGNYCRS